MAVLERSLQALRHGLTHLAQGQELEQVLDKQEGIPVQELALVPADVRPAEEAAVEVAVRFPEEKLIFCMLLKVYAVCVPLLSFTYIVYACNPVNPSPNKSTALNFNRLCLILFPPFLLVINHFIYLFIVNVSMLLLGFLPLNANG